MTDIIRNYKIKHKDLRLEKVTTENYWELGHLTVAEDQKDFVGPNFYSMAYAYATVAEGKFAEAFGIYDGDEPVGYVQVGHNSYDYEGCPEACRHSYDLWRFMIDEEVQGQGYGRDALKLILDYMLTFPDGEEDILTTSYVEGNDAAKHLYLSFGFEPNGEVDGDEIILVLPVNYPGVK